MTLQQLKYTIEIANCSSMNEAAKRLFISTQHYPFVVEAFSKLINAINYNEYDFNLKETKTYEIIEDFKTLRSDIDVLYINKFNSKILNKLFSYNNLKFTPLFNTTPIVDVNKSIKVSDRATLSNLLASTDSYTIGTGVIVSEFNEKV